MKPVVALIRVNRRLILLSLLLFLVNINFIYGSPDCWWTGCQEDRLAVKGCDQYNRTEHGRKECPGGYLYHCCTKDYPKEEIDKPDSQSMYGDATWYDLHGLTACGTYHTDDEFVAATAFSFWTTANPNNDKMCEKMANVTDARLGKTVTVRIRDKCEACKMEDIDLSKAAFSSLRNLDTGRFKVYWKFI